MDAVSDPLVHTVVVMSSAQVGKTEVLLNVIGFHVDQDPAPMLMVQPTLEMAETFSKDRLAPMVRDTPTLSGRIADARSRDSGNTVRHKTFTGGHISLSGANSPASLASRPIRIVLCDEVDRYDESAGTEGDPVSLAVKRATTFWNRKIVLTSTPKIKGLSRIEAAYDESDQRKFWVSCPDCGREQTLCWAQVVWDKDEGTHRERHRPETAGYACEECGSIWNDVQRWQAVRKGEWRAAKEFTGIAGFHISEIYSPWRRLSETVREFLDSKDDAHRLQVWTNTALGECWEEDAEKIDAGALLNRVEAFGPEDVPDEVSAITAGVDTQGDRLEASLWGFGEAEESWLLEHQVLYGDPATTEVWDDLDEWLLAMRHTASGLSMRIQAACIDMGGHHTDQVLRFCHSRRGRRVFAIHGVPGPKPIWTPKASVSKKAKQAFRFHNIGVETAKDALYGRFRLTETGPGFVHIAAGIEPHVIDQLTAEQVVVRKRRGRLTRIWDLPGGRRNEALDCAVYALAARASLGARLHRTAFAPVRLKEVPPPERSLRGNWLGATPRKERHGAWLNR
jgi:phage terminase large subunit GpA-like protein